MSVHTLSPVDGDMMRYIPAPSSRGTDTFTYQIPTYHERPMPPWWTITDTRSRTPCTITATARSETLRGTSGSDVICAGAGC